MRLLRFIPFCLWTAVAVAEEPAVAIARCAALPADGARLICYDQLAKAMGLEGGKRVQNTAGAGRWTVRSETSPINDTKNVYLQLEADTTIRSMWGQTTPTLIARCKENTTEVFVTWNVFLGTDSTEVLERFGSEPARTREWTLSTDNKATFHPGSDTEFLKTMLKHDKLLLQVTPYSESPVMISFDLRGLASVLPELQAACHWK